MTDEELFTEITSIISDSFSWDDFVSQVDVWLDTSIGSYIDEQAVISITDSASNGEEYNTSIRYKVGKQQYTASSSASSIARIAASIKTIWAITGKKPNMAIILDGPTGKKILNISYNISGK